jgi:hypothetical protein
MKVDFRFGLNNMIVVANLLLYLKDVEDSTVTTTFSLHKIIMSLHE